VSQRSGLKVGDKILKRNGDRFRAVGYFGQELWHARYSPGDMRLLIQRNQKRIPFTISFLGVSAAPNRQPATVKNETAAPMLMAAKPDEELGFFLEMQNDEMVVTRVTPGTAADWCGLKVGDKILKVNSERFRAVGYFGQELANARSAVGNLRLVVQRGQQKKPFMIAFTASKNPNPQPQPRESNGSTGQASREYRIDPQNAAAGAKRKFGVSLGTIHPVDNTDFCYGLVIRSVQPGSIAQKQGAIKGWWITEISSARHGQTISFNAKMKKFRGKDPIDFFIQFFAAHQVGDQVTIRIMNPENSKDKTLTFRLP
ncbi:MAG: PDZ domain-containing protein, partial [Planctomycetota bacterium]